MRLKRVKRLFSVFIAVTMSALVFVNYSNVYANTDDVTSYLRERNVNTKSIKDVNSEADPSLPERFDLRDRGVVTPVKFQNPWGTCWGFAAIAASETSILSKMGKTYEETGLDLSEHHLTYFVNTNIEDESNPQYGEGIHMYEGMDPLNTGGMTAYASSVFSSGVGVVDESMVPYRGINSYTVADKNNKYKNKCYSQDDDWTLPYELRFMQSYELKESKMFESPVVFASNTIEGIKSGNASDSEFLGIDQSVICEIKRELMAGRAVTVSFCADRFKPGDEGGVAKYINTEDNKWTHFTYEKASINHGVTIVGWDDTIKSTDFLDHTNDDYGDGLAHQPEGDGAWIIKNSWGSEYSDFPNYNEWGIKDENGKSTGYFYLSYYDRSQDKFESFDFYPASEDSGIYELDQYDYLPSIAKYNVAAKEPLSMANVYTNEVSGSIRSVGFDTYVSDTDVTYQIYALDESDSSPENGELLYENTENFEFTGFYKVDLDTPVHLDAGQKYAIVLTEKSEYDGTEYYILGMDLGMPNKEVSDEMNREIRYSNRGEDPKEYEDSLRKFYAVGIINEGESFLYAGKMENWYDLAEVAPGLMENSDYQILTMDNFSIKSYINIEDEEAIAQYMASSEGATPYKFSKPAWKYNVNSVVNLLATIVTIILYLGLIIYGTKKYKAKKKEHMEYVKGLEAKIAEYEKAAKVDNTDESDNSAENET